MLWTTSLAARPQALSEGDVPKQNPDCLAVGVFSSLFVSLFDRCLGVIGCVFRGDIAPRNRASMRGGFLGTATGFDSWHSLVNLLRFEELEYQGAISVAPCCSY